MAQVIYHPPSWAAGLESVVLPAGIAYPAPGSVLVLASLSATLALAFVAGPSEAAIFYPASAATPSPLSTSVVRASAVTTQVSVWVLSAAPFAAALDVLT